MLSPSPTPSSFPPSLSGDLKSSLIGKSIAMISILSLKIDVERAYVFLCLFQMRVFLVSLSCQYCTASIK